ncbi:MAG: type IV secretory system conjugative DNA transfer family protein [Candidatus Dormibacteraeota bacterium]|nr:type IV secretory system conjugative DNA transfer family protein [Candidatus Dormibacteraeota bacterium]
MDSHSHHWSTRLGREWLALAALGAAWLGSWFVLTLATTVAGGRPSADPLAFIDPAALLRRLPAVHAAAWWVLVAPRRRVNAASFWTCLVTVTVAGAALAVWLANRRPAGGWSHRPRLTSTTRWATRRDLRSVRRRQRGDARFCVGTHAMRRVVTHPGTSVLVIGPTRSGKTSSLVLPNLLEWCGPAVATSTKGELLRLSAGSRQRCGPVYVYDPTGDSSSDAPRVTWSPLAGCDDLDHAWRVAAWLCAGLQSGGRSDNDWQHWAESGKLLIAPLLYAAARTERTVLDVLEWIHGFDLATPASLIDDLADLGDADAPRAVTMLQSVDQRPEKERGTVFSTVMRIFSPLHERAVAASAMSSRFDPVRLIKERGTLYLCTARQSPERVAGLFVGVLMTVITTAYELAERAPSGKLEPELGLFLDELANVVPIEELPSLASQGAGRGVVCMSIVQDVSQLRARYGADRTNSILNNHTCKLLLAGVTDTETTDVVSKLTGTARRTEVQRTYTSGNPSSHSVSSRAEPLASADGLRQLSARQALLLYRGLPPALVRLRPWYRNRVLRRRAAIPYLPSAEFVGTTTSSRDVAQRKHLIRQLFERRLHHAADRDRADVVGQRDERGAA